MASVPRTSSHPVSAFAARPLLVVGAFAPELAPLRTRLGIEGLRAGDDYGAPFQNNFTGNEIVSSATADCADGVGVPHASGCSIQFLESGVGSVMAGAALAEYLTTYLHRGVRPNVLFVGSCGTSDGSFPVLGTICATEVVLGDLQLATGTAYLPEGPLWRLAADEELLDQMRVTLGNDALFTPVYSTSAITRDAEDARTLSAACGARFENLELYGVAVACARVGVPWAAICTVTNFISVESHREWVRNHHSAADRTAVLAERLLSGA